MLFTSMTFIYVFLPLLIITYYIADEKYKNYILLIFSLVFYALGEPIVVYIMIGCVVANYIFGLLVDMIENDIGRGVILVMSIVFNLSFLIYFKYRYFLYVNLKDVFGLNYEVKQVVLPIGISFYTFQAMSYVIDVYRGTSKVQTKLSSLMLYVSFFPQLVAGPIVRYNTIEEQMEDREHSVSMFGEGVKRFCFGLGKKMIIANSVAVVADNAFGLGEGISTAYAWVGAISYALQIYFDFSAYSDMAIGLGLMFGFRFLENFNYPYIASSITDFWRRWHISLGMWFRDYVYIPMGGNRVNVIRNIFNIFVVWFLTGLWHGANYTFIVWGLYFFVLLVIEKYVTKHIEKYIPTPIKIIVTMFFVTIGWVIFRSDNMEMATMYLGRMFGVGGVGVTMDYNMQYFLEEYLILFSIGLVLCIPIYKLFEKLNDVIEEYDIIGVLNYVKITALVGLLYVSTAIITSSSYNPFIYFNF